MTSSTAEFVVPCDDLEATIDWFAERAGFRMLMLRPADDPTEATLEGHGVVVRLDRSAAPGPTALRICVDELPSETALVGPNGTTVEFVLANPQRELPANDPVFVISRVADAEVGAGRAGMGYRDLIPDRQGGRYVASHISIPVGGPVPDYVHHHDIRFQMIFCHAGWADLVYEDQGEPFRFEAGDCVLQPPHIRHRVLHTSDEFEVVEIGSPAVHDTFREHEIELPTKTLDPDRDFGGQRFVWHRAANAAKHPWKGSGFSSIDFGIGPATAGLADVRLVQVDRDADEPALRPELCSDEFLFWFVRSGSATLQRNDEEHVLAERDSVVLVEGELNGLGDVSPDFEILEVRIA